MQKFAFFFLIFPVVFIFILGHIGACVESGFCASALRALTLGQQDGSGGSTQASWPEF